MSSQSMRMSLPRTTRTTRKIRQHAIDSVFHNDTVLCLIIYVRFALRFIAA